jgi:hypothetical protein
MKEPVAIAKEQEERTGKRAGSGQSGGPGRSVGDGRPGWHGHRLRGRHGGRGAYEQLRVVLKRIFGLPVALLRPILRRGSRA